MNLKNIFSKLEIEETDALIDLTKKGWKEKVDFPSRVTRLLENTDKWSPKAIFCFGNKPLILFFENPEKKEELHKVIWNFNETPIVIISEDSMVSIYNGFSINENTELLEKLGGDEVLNDFKYFELVTGKTFEKYYNDFNYYNRVDYRLLENIEATQDKLLEKYSCERKTTNALLGKIIFIRYLIDRKIKLNFDGESKEWTNIDLCKLLDDRKQLFEFFEYLGDKERGFNGNLFPISIKEFDAIPNEALDLVKRLLEGEEIKTNQKSLFQLYDFSVLPIEFISNVYERFIGKENQAKTGAYYTPTFLVDYIISETVAKKLIENGDSISCKVLDPACGSGVFLVETLRKIIEKHIEVYGISEDKKEFKNSIKELVQKNIFGVDKDESAVQVAIFSVYLTLLDYQKPPDIETFQFPELLNRNFFVSDFFDTDASYNKVLEEKSFDFILGNPPWMRGKGEKRKPLFVQYIEKRNKKEKSIDDAPDCVIGNKEIAQAFLIRSSDFSSKDTKCALIVTSKVLYNLRSEHFRKYLLHNYNIERVFELAPVRRQVFNKSNKPATAPACVLFFSYAQGASTELNILEHISLKPNRFFTLFKILTINHTDFQRVQQNKLKKYDWLWKVLVYGSYLDFNFIKRLNKELTTVKNVVHENEILFKQGLKRKDGNKKNDVSELVGKPFLNTQKRHLKPFEIIESKEKWKMKEVGYIYKEDGIPYVDLFKPYSLLIAGGILKDLTSNAAINKEVRVFTSSVRALKIKREDQLDILYSINTIICSSLFSYYMLNVGASAGIEREESEDEEIENMWYISIPDAIEKGKEIEDHNIQKRTLQNAISENLTTKELCNSIVYEILKLSKVEGELINYANDVMIPITMRHKYHELLFRSLNFENEFLEDYAQLFLNRFQSSLNNENSRFFVEIWYTEQVVGMFFRVVPISEYKKDIEWKNVHNENNILSFLISISSERITDSLFVQKDIRGFDKDSFYIFKPNEKRLWHKAIGFLDVNEFADAITKAGRDLK